MNFRKNQSVIYMDRNIPRFAKVVQVVHPTRRNDPGSYVVQFNDNTGARRTRNTVRDKLIPHSHYTTHTIFKRHMNNLAKKRHETERRIKNLEKSTNVLRASIAKQTTQVNRAINELKKHANKL